MTIYHDKYSCNKCAGINNIEIVDTTDGYISECDTLCRDCGHKDYWALGYFKSMNELECKCKTYEVKNE